MRHYSGIGRGGRAGRAACQSPAPLGLSGTGGAETADLRARGVGGQLVRSVSAGRGDLVHTGGASAQLTVQDACDAGTPPKSITSIDVIDINQDIPQ